jgi:hypothetical protein
MIPPCVSQTRPGYGRYLRALPVALSTYKTGFVSYIEMKSVIVADKYADVFYQLFSLFGATNSVSSYRIRCMRRRRYRVHPRGAGGPASWHHCLPY